MKIGHSTTLRDRVHALPQELQDMIEDFVFTADSAERRVRMHKRRDDVVTDWNTPLSVLLVSKATHHKYIASAIKDSTLVFEHFFTLKIWMSKLAFYSPASKELIKDVKEIRTGIVFEVQVDDVTNYLRRFLRKDIADKLKWFKMGGPTTAAGPEVFGADV